MIQAIRSKVALALSLCALLSACGVDEERGSVKGHAALEADYVISVFELKATGAEPCPALSRIESAESADGLWEVCFATPNQLLRVLDCRPKGHDILIEQTGRLLASGENRIGWDLFSNRSSGGGIEYVISGHGEGDLFVGVDMEESERVVSITLETEHHSGPHSFQAPLQFDGDWPKGRALLLYRRISDRANSPWLTVAIELY